MPFPPVVYFSGFHVLCFKFWLLYASYSQVIITISSAWDIAIKFGMGNFINAQTRKSRRIYSMRLWQSSEKVICIFFSTIFCSAPGALVCFVFSNEDVSAKYSEARYSDKAWRPIHQRLLSWVFSMEGDLPSSPFCYFYCIKFQILRYKFNK